MSLAAGTRVGSYEVLSLLGEGGMGAVYRARDSRLGREVAIKVLPANVARDSNRLDRFRREAKVLAAIDHPNIVTIFSVEEALFGAVPETLHFLTMQLVEGQSLDQVIPASGLPLDRLFQIGASIADALSAAHDKSIVHRDLKPANVMVAADGRVKVLDFGLAKELRDSDPSAATLTSAGQTEQGVVMGTPAYMSPEQVAGRAVDHRSDIFSLGILLYQMASGARPFEGASSAELASAILRDTPALVTELRDDLPADLARLIRRCLEKDPNQRIQTARDIANECRDLSRQVVRATGAPATARRAGAGGSSSGTRPDEGFRVAVLPFKYSGANADITSLAEGLSEEIVTGLSRFSYLRVMARAHTVPAAHQAADLRSAGHTLGARYVMEGSLRQAGSQLRIAVQLVDATTGAHLWADTYDRDFDPAHVFALQDDLVPQIVSTVADWYGVLPRSMSDALRHKPVDQLSPYEAVLRSFGYSERRTPEEHRLGRQALERAIQQADGHADAWALVSILHSEEYATGFNSQPDPLGRALDAARRAIDADPSNALGHFALARARFFRKEFPACRAAAEQALALNPMDGGTIAFIGVLLAYAGDWERGCGLVERAAALNPRHPSWYWFPLFLNAYRKSDYAGALRVALRINLPNFFFSHVMMAAVQGQLGDGAAAAEALRELFALRPDFASTGHDDLEKWYPPDLVGHLIDGLRKSGLDVQRAGNTGAPAVAGQTADGKASSSIAVLPFTNMSADQDQDYFSDGLAEEIINLLAGVSGLKVIARTSSFSFRGKEQDVRRIAEALGVTHVLEGSVRRAGDRVRVTAQLIAAADGTHSWSERYDRPMTDVFAMQDDMAGAITTALKGRLSVARTRARPSVPNLDAYESYLSGRTHLNQFTPEAWSRAKADLDRAMRADPSYAKPHAELALAYFIRGMHFMQPMREVEPFVRAEVTRALELDPTDPQPRFVLGAIALAHDYQWEEAAGHFAASMNGPHVPSHARWIYASLYLRGLGRFEESAAEMARAAEQDPLNATWHAIWAAHLIDAGRVDEAIGVARRSIEIDPTYFLTHNMLGEASWAAGLRDEAVAAFERAHALAPWFGVASGWLAAVHRLTGREDRADALLASVGPTSKPLWGRVVYHLLTSELDAAADWYEEMIEERDPFALLYARTPTLGPLRNHHRWPDLAALMKLPAVATPT